MLQFTHTLTAAVAAALFVAPFLADAHSMVIIPPPEYTTDDKGKQWAPIAFMEGQYPVGPDLLGFIKSKGAKTLRDFMDNKSLYKVVNDPVVSFECGRTKLDAPRKPIPADGRVRTSTYTHEGPCEIWLDDTRVLHGDNCNKEFSGTRPFTKIDWGPCKGDCVLRWYWFGNRFVNNGYSWQVYKNCIPMKGSGDSLGGGGSAKPVKNATSDAVGNDNDAAPTSTKAQTVVPTPANVSTTAPTPGAPSSPSKCKAKRNRALAIRD